MSDARLARWQNVTLGTLFTGYVGYYICRANLSVCTPLLLQEYGSPEFNKETIGNIASAGLIAYVIGKITNGLSADYLGGKKLFITGMIGSIVCTVLFGLSGVAAFTLIWAVNRYFQSMGWVSLVKVASRWYPVYRHATVMGILSASYLIGDAIAKAYLGTFITYDFGWRSVFGVAAGTFSLIAVGALLLLRSSPNDVGELEPAANPENVYGHAGDSAEPVHVFTLLAPLFKNFTFWIVCVINFGLTLIRETFNFWTPTFLFEATGLAAGDAAIKSLLFPLVGAASVFIAGLLSDRLGRQHGRVVVPCLVLLVVTLFLLSNISVEGRPTLALIFISAVSFFLLAPYSYLSGVMALDIGGKRGSSTTSGLIDAAGYLGAILSGTAIGQLAENYGWTSAFRFLAWVSVATIVAAVIYWVAHERSERKLRDA